MIKYRKRNIVVILLFAFQIIFSQNTGFEMLRKQFLEGYTALDIPNLQVNYVQNLMAIKSVEDINNQEVFF